ncbi:hypothetical protein [Yeosuana marina]|uniref:hypothetical protein n=1 Tax=Yeosuana marina TaxID=1565536 RepID=UPI0030EF188C|tara:strand:+ start:433 stop:963 length:531 start_codon:yes stop_codon:yes gene_type:complete
MNNLYKRNLFFSFFLLVVGCSNGGASTTNSNNAKGTIHLTGDDTLNVGTTLIVGDIAEGRADLTGTEDSIIIVDEGTTISNDPAHFPPGDPRNVEVFNRSDPDNGFVIVIKDGAVSISIVVQGILYTHACDSEFNVFTNCGSLDLILNENKVIFTDTTVENTDTGAILTLNGTVTW